MSTGEFRQLARAGVSSRLRPWRRSRNRGRRCRGADPGRHRRAVFRRHRRSSGPRGDGVLSRGAGESVNGRDGCALASFGIVPLTAVLPPAMPAGAGPSPRRAQRGRRADARRVIPAGGAAGPVDSDRRWVRVTTPGRFGQQVSAGAASFRCAVCGEMAAVLKAVPADGTPDMGPPLGGSPRTGTGSWWTASAGPPGRPPRALRTRPCGRSSAARRPTPPRCGGVDWELAPFYCPDCAQNYCRAAGAPASCSMTAPATAPWAGAPTATSR
jgi:hypothetical protein